MSPQPLLTRPAAPPAIATALTLADVDRATEALAQALAATAVERDRQGGHAAAERRLIRDSGLLGLIVPRSAGGLGADWATLYRVVRRLAQVDSALAHVFSFHHLQIASLLLYGNAEQQHRLLRQTIDEDLFWGNALNPLDASPIATPTEGGWLIQGAKRYASGSLGSDRITFSARVAAPGGHDGPPLVLIGNIATGAPGIHIHGDWDSFGQRQTDSGTISFHDVFLPQRDVLQAPGSVVAPRTSLRTQVSQLTMANLYLGIAQGAFEAARRYSLEQARAWLNSGVDRSVDDPYVQHRYGQLWLLIRPAELLADAAAHKVMQALERGESLTAQERGEAAVAVAEAKVLAHRASVEVSSQLFELTGAASTSARHGLDRYWRNARVHTLHDPVDYKLRDIGRYRLDGRVPEPTPYS